MHKSFLITEEDKNRILGMHENATKRQYLNEQTECPNIIGNATINSIARNCGETFKKMDAPLIRRMYSEDWAKLIYNEVSKLVSKNYYDDLTGECIPAMNKFNELYKSYSSGLVIAGGDFETDIKSLISDQYYDDKPEILRYLNGAIKVYKGEVDPTKLNKTDSTQPKTAATQTTTTYTQYANKDTIEKIQKALKDKKYDLGNYGPNKDGVDGKFGNLTANAILDLISKSPAQTTPPKPVATQPTDSTTTTK